MAEKKEAKTFKSKFTRLSDCSEVTIKKNFAQYKTGQKVKMHPNLAEKLKKAGII